MSAPATAAEPTASSASGLRELSHRQIMTILVGLMIGMFLASLDQTIVSTAIVKIANDLNGLSLQAWATTAYLITSTISTPLYGKLSDIYGRRPFYLTAISIFVVGSLASSFATSMYQLAAFRGFQGLGAGGLMSLALAILGDILPPREMSKYQAYFLSVFGISSVLGPVLGGLLADANQILWITGWRWVFLVNVPIGLIALVVVGRVLRIPHVHHPQKIDWWGAGAVIVALVPLLVVAEQGRDWGWGSAAALTCYGIGVVGVALFVLAERIAGDAALIPLKFFRLRGFSIGTGLNFVVGMGMFGALAGLPMYLQISKGLTPTQAGLLLITMTVGIMAGSIGSGQLIARTGHYRIFPVIGTTLLLAAVLALGSNMNADTPLWYPASVATFFGIGLGLCMQPMNLVIQTALPVKDMGVATASSTFFRQMGGTLGTAVFLSVLFSTVQDKIAGQLKDSFKDPAFLAALKDPKLATDPANHGVLAVLKGIMAGKSSGATVNDTSFLTGASDVLTYPFRQGFAQSSALVMLSAAVILIIGIGLSIAIPRRALRERSGIGEQIAEGTARPAATAE